MATVTLDERDQSLLEGAASEAEQLAMSIVVRIAEIMGADHLLDITGAHIDSCLYHGRTGLDFALRLAGGGARVRVPTTLNVSSLDLLHPELYHGDATEAQESRRQMELYEQMGARPTWTCAPYQLPQRPGFGEQIAWAESNAIVFANSVIGARTHRYGDFIDISAAITGRAPAAGLHLTGNRRAQMLFRLRDVPDRLATAGVLYPVLGHLVGQMTGQRIPAIEGLPQSASEDDLKALGAAAASSGSVALFHAVGITPEAATLDDALQRQAPAEVIDVTPPMLRRARDSLTTATEEGELGAVSLGTPHFSFDEFSRLVGLLDGRRVRGGVECYVSTGRDVLARVEATGWGEILRRAGVQTVVDTCTYITPIIRGTGRRVMTESAKWAFYAPGNLGVDVVFGSLEECVESVIAGEVVRDAKLWADV